MMVSALTLLYLLVIWFDLKRVIAERNVLISTLYSMILLISYVISLLYTLGVPIPGVYSLFR